MAISTGVITILVFQNKFFNRPEQEQHNTVVTNAEVNDKTQIF
jgi:signal peptidase II